MAFLPINRRDMEARGWDAPDFVYAVGEAYVDHPSFGHSIISRILERAGYRVAMLCLPDYHNVEDFKRFGRPKFGFIVSSGVIDSMVNHYTVSKKRRNQDVYAPGGKAGLRPDRCVTVYCNKIHEAYPGMPIVIGGVEASLRRFSHYDYWEDKIKRSILVDSAATLLLFGMGERTIVDACNWIASGMPQHELPTLRGTCYMQKTPPRKAILLPSHQEVASDKNAYSKAFLIEFEEQDPIRGKMLCQQQDDKRYLVQSLPDMPLSTSELDDVYTLPFERNYHPIYEPLGGVPALEEVKFSLASVRGCFGACNFCALTFHQGRIVSSRSDDSLVAEAILITQDKDFKGYIHDVGGPTANFREPACAKQMRLGTCKNRQCMHPTPCKNLKVTHESLCVLLEKLRNLPKVKKVFVRSGIRFDYLIADPNPRFMRDLVKYHISGQLKVAPEHVADSPLDLMGKPRHEVYEKFVCLYESTNRAMGKNQFLVPYMMSSHPGCTLADAITLAEYLRDTGRAPEQVQDFYPTPGTMSTCIYYTEIDPRNNKSVFVPKTAQEKAMQRALLQYRNPKNYDLVRKALMLCDREDLIGFSKKALIRPRARTNSESFSSQRSYGKPSYNSQSNSKSGSGSRSGSKSSSKSGSRSNSKSNSNSKPQGKSQSNSYGTFKNSRSSSQTRSNHHR